MTPLQSVPSALLVTTEPYHDESLPSLCARLEDLNHYHPPTIIHALISTCLRASAIVDDLAAPLRSVTFEVVAALSTLSPTALARTVLPPWIQPYLLPVDQAQWCPLCLREGAYHRWRWFPSAVTVCLQHNCCLVHQCPQCERSISILSIVRTTCQWCQATLLDAPVEVIESDPLVRSQVIIQSWLGIAPRANDVQQHRFPAQPIHHLYSFLEALRFRIEHADLSDKIGWLDRDSTGLFHVRNCLKSAFRQNKASPSATF